MKILFLTPQLPYPPQKGTAMRNWGLISGLSERHEVAVLSFLDPGQSPGLDPLLTATCRVEVVEPPARSLRDRLRDVLVTRQPDMALRLASEAYAAKLAGWLRRENFDVVHVEGIEMAPYLDVIGAVAPPPAPPTRGGEFSTFPSRGGEGSTLPSREGEGTAPLLHGGEPSVFPSREGGLSRPLVVFDDHNCEYLLQKRVFLTDLRAPARWPGAAYSFVQWLRLRRYEAWACRRADRVLAVSEADAAALRRLVPGVGVTVVPNGIDTQMYTPAHTRSETPTLVFTGTMDFRPNVDAVLWFVGEVLPRVRAEVPEVCFLAVGQRPHRRLDTLRNDPAVRLTGWVEDTRPYIAGAAVYVVPLRMGGGTRFKILEAMAMGKAVVSTTLGAEGFPVTHGRELLLADGPADFAAAVVALLRASGRRDELGRAGRAFIEARYDWRAIVPLVEAAYESPMSR